MAKYKRTVIGSIVKSRTEGEADYLKISTNVVLKEGQSLKLESKKSQLASLAAAVAAGKISGENADKAQERLEKIPDFVRFQVVQVEKFED